MLADLSHGPLSTRCGSEVVCGIWHSSRLVSAAPAAPLPGEPVLLQLGTVQRRLLGVHVGHALKLVALKTRGSTQPQVPGSNPIR